VSTGIALLFLGPRHSRWGWGFSPTPRPPLPTGKTRYSLYRRLGGTQDRSGRSENLVPTGIRSRTVRTVRPVVSRFTDWATDPRYYTVMLLTKCNQSGSICGAVRSDACRTGQDCSYQTGLATSLLCAAPLFRSEGTYRHHLWHRWCWFVSSANRALQRWTGGQPSAAPLSACNITQISPLSQMDVE